MKTNNIFNSKRLLLLLLIITIGFAGCKKFLDVNQNPNNPDTADPILLLPTVEAAIGQVVGNNFQIYGGIWGQYWTQSPSSSQYRALDQYNITNTAFDRPWLITYRNALQNAQLIIENQTPNYQHIQGIAYLLKAYTFQVATDGFGDIPLSEALQGNDFGSPNFERQELVYDSIFSYIDLGIALINTPDAISPGDQDLIFQGDMEQWLAFANTLKLKAYLRLSEVSAAEAQTGITALYNTNPVFLVADATIDYTTIGGNENPLYNEQVGLGYTQNLVASGTAVRAFNANNDPRVFRFYDLVAGDTISYIPQGSYSSNANKSVSPPSALVGGRASNTASATAPVKLISSSESYFLQAEAVARGWGTGDVAVLFEQGIRESFIACGIPNEASAYIQNAPDAQLPIVAADVVGAIITQKYFAMCGFQGFEAWTEWRRTGYPEFLVVSAASILGNGRVPLRFLYPNSEVTTNLNYPGTIPLYEPVWWDVGT